MVKSSELNVDGVKLIELNRANFECSVTQPNILMFYQILDIFAIFKNQHSFWIFNTAIEDAKILVFLRDLKMSVDTWKHCGSLICLLSIEGPISRPPVRKS